MSEATPPVRDQLLAPAAPFSIAWPLTTDGLDTNGGNPLVALTGNPISAGIGFVANGYDTKLVGDLPTEAQNANTPLAAHVIASAPGPSTDWREVVCSVTTTVNDTPKIELAVVDDPSASAFGAFQLRSKASPSTVVTRYLNRCNWRFEFRTPETIANPLVQSLCWLDDDELLFAVDTGSVNVLYRVDATTGEYTGRASSTTYDHINSMHVDPDGNVWCQCVVGGFDQRKQIDLAASFSTGTITEAASWNTGDVPTSSIAFATLGSVEYVLLSQHATTGTPRVYVFLRSQMSSTVNQVDRVTRWRCGFSVQDLAFRPSDGKVYVSRSSSAGGTVEAYDLAALLLAADDSTPTPTVVSHAPTRWPQGIDFHPTTDRAWVGSEGFQTPGDAIGHSAIWSSALTGAETNAYLFDYTGGTLQVRLNGRLMHDFAHICANAPQKVSVGAAPSATAGLTGFLTAGTVRALAIKSTPFTQTELDTLLAG